MTLGFFSFLSTSIKVWERADVKSSFLYASMLFNISTKWCEQYIATSPPGKNRKLISTFLLLNLKNVIFSCFGIWCQDENNYNIITKDDLFIVKQIVKQYCVNK